MVPPASNREQGWSVDALRPRRGAPDRAPSPGMGGAIVESGYRVGRSSAARRRGPTMTAAIQAALNLVRQAFGRWWVLPRRRFGPDDAWC